MIHFFVGTKAQLIKTAPLMVELRRRGIPFRYVDSGQHAELTRSIRTVFGLPDPDVSLAAGAGDVVSVRQAVDWYVTQLWRSVGNRAWLRGAVFPGGGICLIHGDTLSTLLGLQFARRAGLRVGHVEAGLRSFCWWEPFPEELIRMWCMRRSDVLFAPSEAAAGNLERMRVGGRVVRVSGNTVADALRLAGAGSRSVAVPQEPFALATCHRLETISRRGRLGRVAALWNRVAERMPVLLVLHEPTEQRLRRFGLLGALHPAITRLGLLEYGEFVALLKAARLVLTDGGSIQEECAYLGKPCLITRMKTERREGLGANAVLWGFDDATAERFLAEVDRMAARPRGPLPRPSAEIVDALVEMGYADAT